MEQVFRCACGWSGGLEHLKNGRDCMNCGKLLAGDTASIFTPPQRPAAVNGYGLGRLPAMDPRDQKYQMAAALQAAGINPLGDGVPKAQTSKSWVTGEVLDQGETPQCVAYAWTGFLLSSPVRTKIQGMHSFAATLYREAQRVDEWPGENYAGTSVRAGAKVLKGFGRIRDYVWAKDAETLRTYILTVGPAVIGVNWYYDMFDADPQGKRPLNVSGGWCGGHAILVTGYSSDQTAFRILNSWGAGWGAKGKAWLTFSDMQQLLRDEDGEACSTTEIAQ